MCTEVVLCHIQYFIILLLNESVIIRDRQKMGRVHKWSGSDLLCNQAPHPIHGLSVIYLSWVIYVLSLVWVRACDLRSFLWLKRQCHALYMQTIHRPYNATGLTLFLNVGGTGVSGRVGCVSVCVCVVIRHEIHHRINSLVTFPSYCIWAPLGVRVTARA